MRNAVDSLVSRPADNLERTSVLSIPRSDHELAGWIACDLESA